MKQIQINNNLALSNSLPIVLIAGPCQIESEDHALTIAGKISDIAKKLGIGYVYKSSFDKANRTSINSKRGIGIKGACKIFDVNNEIACTGETVQVFVDKNGDLNLNCPPFYEEWKRKVGLADE